MLGCVDQVTRAEPSRATDRPVPYLLAEIKQPCFSLLASCLLSTLKTLCLTLFDCRYHPVDINEARVEIDCC